jgi:PEP-CTERM motif
MTVKHGCGLIAALTFLAALSFPGSATAQSYQFSGLTTFSFLETNTLTGQVEFETGTVPGSLTIDLSGVGPGFAFGDMTIAPTPLFTDELSGAVIDGVFGPSGISGSFDEGIGDAGVATGFFSVDFQNFAVANTFESLFENNSDITETVEFQTVPEPSTFTLAAIGVLAVGIFMKSRRPLAPRNPRPGLSSKVIDLVVRSRA